MQDFVSSIPEDITEEQAIQLQEQFLSMSGDFEEKISDCVKYMREQEVMANAINEEIARLSDLKKPYERKATQMENYIDTAMKLTGTQSLTLGIAKISYKKSTICVVDENIISDEWKKKKEVVTVDKAGIKKALQE